MKYNIRHVLNGLGYGKLIRSVRTAQGIPQQFLADHIGVTQAAIAAYENGRYTLSDQNLKKLAPYINMNPDFIGNRQANPFKQAHSDSPISMKIPDDHEGNIDLDLLRIIAAWNLKADVVLLKIPNNPDEMKNVARQRSKGNVICAIALRDTNGNVFLFRKKNKNSFFDEKCFEALWFTLMFDSEESSKISARCHFFTSEVETPADLFEQIQRRDIISTEKLLPFFPKSDRTENIEFIKDLVKLMWSRSAKIADVDEKKAILAAIDNVGEEYYSRLMPAIFDKIKNIIRQHTAPKSRLC